MSKRDAAFILGETWRRGLRPLYPDQLTRAAVLLARQTDVPRASACEATSWPESRRQRAEALLRQLSSPGRGQLQDLSSKDWAQVLWSAAKCRATLPPALADSASAAISAHRGAAACSEPAGGELGTSDVARLMWSAATLRWTDQAFLQGASVAVRGNLEECSPHDLSNMAWAAAQLREESLSFFAADVMAEFARRFGDRGSGVSSAQRPPAQAVGNVLTSLAKIKTDARSRPGGRVPEGEAAEDFQRKLRELPAALAPAAISVLAGATPQGVVNMMWSYARLGAREDRFLEAACKRMSQLLEDCEAQDVANAAWAIAKLTSSPSEQAAAASSLVRQAGSAGPAASCPAAVSLLREISDHLHAKIKMGEMGREVSLRRWARCSYKHVSVLCWAYGKALPNHRATRQLLRDAAVQCGELSDQGGLKAQEHANILWAWSECFDSWYVHQRPKITVGRLLDALCAPSMKLVDDSPLAWNMSVTALAKLYPQLLSKDQSRASAWLDKVSRRATEPGALASFSSSEIVGVLRSMVTARSLHAVLYHTALRELQKEARASSLQPRDHVAVLDAAAYLRPETLPATLADLLAEAVAQLPKFRPQDLAAFLWSLQRLSHFCTSARVDLDHVLAACTQAIAQSGVRFPSAASLDGADASRPGGLDATGPAHPARPPRCAMIDIKASKLKMREWVWVMNAVGPLKLDEGGSPQGPQWLLDSLATPWASWMDSLAREMLDAAELVSSERAAASKAVAASVNFRYKGVLQREGLDGVGLRWTPFLLSRVGVNYLGSGLFLEAAQAVATEEKERRHDKGRFGRFAWLRVRRKEKEGLSVLFESSSWEQGAGDDKADPDCDDKADPEASGSANSQPGGQPSAAATDSPDGLLAAGRRKEHRPEFKLLAALTKELDNLSADGAPPTELFLYSDLPPSLSCIGALLQVRLRWPGLALHVSFRHGQEGDLAAASVPGRIQQEAGSQDAAPVVDRKEAARLLEKALLRGIPHKPGAEGVRETRIAILGCDPRVRELWPLVCATGVRQSGPGVVKKKREWQDKLKYFLAHRPGAFLVEEEGPAALVRAVGPEEQGRADIRVGHAQALVGAVEDGIAEMISMGKFSKGCPAGEGFVTVEEVGCFPPVSRAWRKLRHDGNDSLSYWLRHTEGFEVWSPPRPAATPTSDGQAVEIDAKVGDKPQVAPLADKRSWVRVQL